MAKAMKAKKAKGQVKTRSQHHVKKGPGGKLRVPGKKATSDKLKDVTKSLGKIRIGIVWGKVFDPVKVGAQDRDYPQKLRIRNNTGPKAAGWGGQFQVDVNTGLKIGRIAPDIFHMDFMDINDVTENRLSKNHINFNFWGCMSVALMEKGKAACDRICKVQKNPDCRHLPTWPDYEFITFKTRYMKALVDAGVPTIDSIILEDGFNAKDVLKKAKAKGWDKFLVKPAYMSFFSAGVLPCYTAELVNDLKPLLDYEKEYKNTKYFLVQPYVLKPNGDVFDEIRNFIVNGEWQYSVFTHGTDDDAVYEQPPGTLKDAAREIAIKAYEVLKKYVKWEGVPVHTLLTRIDVGVMPDPLVRGGWRVFINELEPALATWLGRYCPFELSEKMATVCVAQVRHFLRLSLKKKRKLPNAANVETLLQILDGRLGPAPNVEQ